MWSTFNDGWMHFLSFKISTPIHCHYRAWKIVFVWKKKIIYTKDGLRVSKSWGHFHFWVHYPFKATVYLIYFNFSLFTHPFFLMKRAEQTVSGKIQRSPSANMDDAFSEMDTLVRLVACLYLPLSQSVVKPIQPYSLWAHELVFIERLML